MLVKDQSCCNGWEKKEVLCGEEIRKFFLSRYSFSSIEMSATSDQSVTRVHAHLITRLHFFPTVVELYHNLLGEVGKVLTLRNAQHSMNITIS